jgi:hypothetical protein
MTPRDRGVGPPGPGDDDARPKPGHAEQVVATTNSTPATIKASGHLHAKPAGRQCCHNTVGRHADAWREGFGYGFRDALRLAAREIDDPAVWLVLDRLAERGDS